MPKHTFRITYPESVRRGETVTAGLVIKPPFDVPELLSKIALGADSRGMEIEHCGDGTTVSVFKVAATRGSEKNNHVALARLGRRVASYANNPSLAAEMMRDRPFA